MNKEYKHFVIYQITNLVNGMIYIGQHSTNNLDDGYMGSGVYLKEDQLKYGLDKFKKDILFECQSREELSNKEAELVDDEFVNRMDTYNLVRGGGYIVTHGQAAKSGKLGQTIHYKKYQEDEEYRESIRKKLSESSKRMWKEHPEKFKNFKCDWTGRHHSEETKKRMSEIGKLKVDSKNGMFGRIWIHNELVKTNATILMSQLHDYLEQGWDVGRIDDWNAHFINKKHKDEIAKRKISRMKFNDSKEPQKGLDESIDKHIEYYSSLLPIYLKYRWKEFVHKTGYEFSNQNFHYQVKVYLKLDRPTLKIMKRRARSQCS